MALSVVQPTPVRLKMYLANPEIDADDSRASSKRIDSVCLVGFFLTENQNISGEADGGGSVQEPAAGVTSASHVLFILSKRRNICRIDRHEQQARTLGVLNGFDLIFKRRLTERKKKPQFNSRH